MGFNWLLLVYRKVTNFCMSVNCSVMVLTFLTVIGSQLAGFCSLGS